MRRVVDVELTEDERGALERCELRRRDLAAAARNYDVAILSAVALGLPMRIVAAAAGCSTAHVSRLVNGKAGANHASAN